MHPACQELNAEERALARTLWPALTSASTQRERESSQQQLQQLKDRAPHIQRAVINALARAMKEQRNIHPDENPFD